MASPVKVSHNAGTTEVRAEQIMLCISQDSEGWQVSAVNGKKVRFASHSAALEYAHTLVFRFHNDTRKRWDNLLKSEDFV